MLEILRQWFCRHRHVQMRAATCAHYLGRGRFELGVGINVEVGVVALCPDCGRVWVADIVAGLATSAQEAAVQHLAAQRGARAAAR